ncbi:MAG: hypothetical protein H6620_03455 [Halobacteriovoraceae bacterium]|nr:hypothetical protein [Halobacteriovoraceae bacterium]
MKNKNLYVIHKGNVVEESKNIVDYLLKRTGLDQFIDALIQLLKAILEQITSSEQIKDLLRFLDVLTGRLQIMFGSLFI